MGGAVRCLIAIVNHVNTKEKQWWGRACTW